jgi:hypothetical protein
MEPHYISRTNDCWLRVKLTDGSIASLPYGLKVKRLEVKDGREHFEILEGVNKGKKASVQLRIGGSYLTTKLSHSRAATVQFDRKNQTLSFQGRGSYNAFSGGGHAGYTQIAPGSYELAIPAYPSAQTRAAYHIYTSYHNSWFRIGTSTTGSRFLHAGMISEGCVTVRQFIYDPNGHVAPPPGFADLPQLAKTAPGLLGLPFPAKSVSAVGWDVVYDALILCRKNDQAIGTLVVK